MVLSVRQKTFRLELLLVKRQHTVIQILSPLCGVVLLVSEQCLRGIVMNWPFKVYKAYKKEHGTREVGFLWEVYKPLSDF